PTSLGLMWFLGLVGSAASMARGRGLTITCANCPHHSAPIAAARGGRAVIVMFSFLCNNFRCKAPIYCAACPDHTPLRSGYRRPAHTPPRRGPSPFPLPLSVGLLPGAEGSRVIHMFLYSHQQTRGLSTGWSRDR